MKRAFILGSILILLVLSAFVYAAETMSSDAESPVSGAVESVYQHRIVSHVNVVQETRDLPESENNIEAVAAEKQLTKEDSKSKRKRVLEPVTTYPTKSKNKVTGSAVRNIVHEEAEVVQVAEYDVEKLVKKIYDQRKKLKAVFNLFGDKYKEQYGRWISEGVTFEELEQNVNDVVGADYNKVYGEDLLLHISVGCGN